MKERRTAELFNGHETAAAEAAAADAAEAEASFAPKRPRRSCRSNAGAKMSVEASGSTDINGLKLLLYQQAQISPSQACLYFEGSLLDDESATLAAVGVLAGSTLQLFVDTEIEADDQAALEKLGVSSKGKRAVEDGFVGCALLGGMADAAGSAPSEPMVIDT